jgi:hypothetical protein
VGASNRWLYGHNLSVAEYFASGILSLGEFFPMA